MPEKDAPIERLIRQIIGTSKRGRGKVIAKIRRNHPSIGSSKIRRIYEQKGFTLMKRHKKRFRTNPKNPAIIPMGANIEWGIDFMHDSLVTGKAIRSLNILDPFNRECKGAFIRHSIPAKRLTDLLDRCIEKHGKPKYIRSDNGPEMISKWFQKWMQDNSIGWSPIEKGKPQQNCFVERFNRTMREEFFDAHLFFCEEEAQREADKWVEEYNEDRPHESLQNKTPIEHAA